ncbi:nucleoside phosphatase family-domain-containing protein [Infundibulicybe gibba]|nr:nucleoside phosphatase family-domain-containing protein [Infundibulicybe gibba]
MPPPTVVDPWLAGRHFGIIIDAGSSGSRLQIYSWMDPKGTTILPGSALAHSLPRVEKGTQQGDEWVRKVEPGISAFADDPERVADHLRPLLAHARDRIPPSLQPDTPLFLLATAGMRLLDSAKQAAILQEACKFLSLHSHFRIDTPTASGPCGSSVRIITGEEEGLFGWIAVNYLMDGFTASSLNRTTYGFLDMGGASTQIAFEPSPQHRGDAKNLIDVRLRLMGGEEISHKVFVTTWLGYGTNQARERYVSQTLLGSGRENDSRIMDPCLPKGLQLTESPHTSTSTSSPSHHLVGTGSFERCMQNTATLLNKNAPCPDSPCLMNGVHVPPIDFSVSHFIGVSEYWYSSEHIFGLGGAYDFVQYERAASKFCARDWDGIIAEHEQSRKQHRLGGDGEVEQDGKVVAAGKWGSNVELPRLQMQCFKAAWVTNVLHEGLGMPRIVDPGGNSTTDGDKVVQQAEMKGLGKPTFQSLDTVGDLAITWTLGKMVLEASKEVPFAAKTDRPLADPIDGIQDLTKSPIQPIRPPFINIIEDKISPHLPSSLSRTSLGFSPVLLLFYITVCCILALLVCPLRRQLRAACLRSIRGTAKRDISIEEGYSTSPTSAPKSLLQPLRRLFHQRTTSHSSRHTPFPAHNSVSTASATQYAISRSPSPAPGYKEEGGVFSNGSRSRNASQINLSGIVPRPAAISRNGSMHQDE